MSTDNVNETLVNITINGTPATAKAGETIIEAARKAGTNIAHFCWHPGLSIAGVCRLCMVKVEGMPKLQIACNTPVREGMKIETEVQEVKDAQKWALEFHLVNHPLDCPICDQAGECKLQDYYMKVGRYDSQVEEPKVLKPKALDVGRNLVLDTERCILCTRCIRFEDEVTKTGSLGIFNRGDRSVIGLTPGKKVDHNYSYNLADVCPVGAFTVKDFRFRCRVWFLTETKTICPGCSTGCNVSLFRNRNERKYYRLKPRVNPDVNGHWMCDYGRTMYMHLNGDVRRTLPLAQGTDIPWATVGSEMRHILRGMHAENVALVLTPQYTNEEYEATLATLERELGGMPEAFVWRPADEKPEEFDGILFRGDRHPNTRGMMDVLQSRNVKPVVLAGDFSPLARKNPDVTIVLGPEIVNPYRDIESELARLAELRQVVYAGTCLSETARRFRLLLPTKVFAEKNGTFVNFKGIAQKLGANPTVIPGILGVDDVFAMLAKTPV